MKTLIKNVKLVTHQQEAVLDIYMNNGIFEQIGVELQNVEADEIIDGSNFTALPGLVDIHCHLRDPGYTYKEDIKSGTRSAAKGGYTSVVAMPNTLPVVDNSSVVESIYKKAATDSAVHLYQAGAISKGLEGAELAEMGEMKEAGIVAVTDDGHPVTSSSLMKKALLYADMLSLPVIAHEEDLELADGGSMNEGFMSTLLGLRGIPAAVEETMTARDIILAGYTNTRVHITHISTKGSVEMIRRAKRDGIKVTCDTCPHYFSLTDAACEGFNTNAKMNPPLRGEEDRLAIIEGLKDGTIDCICTDHAPHHQDEKKCAFDKALNGIIGFETALALSMKILVNENKFTLLEIVRLMSYNPAKLLALPAGEVKVGGPADLILLRNEKYRYEEGDILSKGKNSPFIGYEFDTRVSDVFVSGNRVL